MRKKFGKEIDGMMLKRELAKRGYSMSAAGVKMGKCEGFIAACVKRNSMGASELMLVESLFGISYDAIKPREEPEKVVKVVSDDPADYGKIADAVQEGVLTALEQFMEILKDKYVVYKVGGKFEIYERSEMDESGN